MPVRSVMKRLFFPCFLGKPRKKRLASLARLIITSNLASPKVGHILKLKLSNQDDYANLACFPHKSKVLLSREYTRTFCTRVQYAYIHREAFDFTVFFFVPRQIYLV